MAAAAAALASSGVAPAPPRPSPDPCEVVENLHSPGKGVWFSLPLPSFRGPDALPPPGSSEPRGWEPRLP